MIRLVLAPVQATVACISARVVAEAFAPGASVCELAAAWMCPPQSSHDDDVGHARRELPVEDFVLVCARSLQKIKIEIPSFLITEFTHVPFESYPLR